MSAENGSKVKSRRRSPMAIAAFCLAAVAAHGQYVEDSIDVGAGWVGSLAYNSRADVLYGGCQTAGIFFAISCDSNKVVRSLALDWPRYMAFDSVDNRGYVAFKGAEEDSLAVIDGSTHQVVKKIEMSGATMPVWDPVSNRVFVSCQTTDMVAVVDCATDSILKYISVGACPMKMYLNTIGRRLYVQNYDAATVSIIDLTTDLVIKTLNVGGNPNAGYYCQGAGKFYSAGPIRQCVVISGHLDTIVARVPLPGDVEVVSATGNENGTLVYLGTSDGGIDDCVATVSTANDSVQAVAIVDGDPNALACYWGSGLVYCATARIGRLFVLSSDGAQVLDTLQLGWCPSVLAQVPRHGRLYVGHSNTRFVYVLRDTSAGVSGQQLWSKFSGALRASPNPFARSVTLAWSSPRGDGGVVRVYAQDGRLVRQARISAGQNSWVWNGRDGAGASAPPGVYVVETGAGGRRKIIKLHQ